MKSKLKRFITIILFYILASSPSFLWSQGQERGRLFLTYQGQVLKIVTPGNKYGQGYFSFLNSIYFDFWHHFDKGGALAFSINYYFSREFREITSYSLGLHELALGRFRLDVDLGYLSYPISSLTHFSSFNPSTHRSLKGGKITLSSSKMDLLLFGGEAYDTLGAGGRKNRIYGTKAIFRPNRAWTIGAGWMKLSTPTAETGGDAAADPEPGEPGEPGGSPGINYDIFSLDSSLRVLNGLYLLGDFRLIPGSPKNKEDGISVKTGTVFNTRDLTLEIFYNYVTPGFPYLGSVLIQARRGLTVMGQIRPNRWLSLFAGWDTYNEDLENLRENLDYFSDYMTYRGGAAISVKSLPHLSLSFNKGKRETGTGTAGNPDISGSSYDMIFLSLSRQYRRFYWNFYLHKGNFNSRSDITGNYSLNRYHLNLYRSYWNGSTVYFNGYLERRKGELLVSGNDNLNIQVGSDLKLSSRMILNLEISGNINRDKISSRTNRQWGMGGSIFYRLLRLKINCSLRYRYANARDSTASIIENISPAGRYMHQVFFSISKDLNWGKDASIAEALGMKGLFTRKTGIKGCVFVDSDQNQLKDPGEEGLEGIFILLDGRKTAKTNRMGNFTLSGIRPGTHRVSMDLRNVPAFYEADRENVEVILKKGESRQVNLTVIPMALISGKLVLDVNENNTADKDEPGITGVRIDVLKESESYQSAFTDTTGVFTFGNVRPGSYMIAVAGDTIKETYSPGEKSVLEITVKPWEEKRGLILLVTKYKKPKIKKKLN